MRQGTQLASIVAEMEEDVNAHMMAAHYAKAFIAALATAKPSLQKILFYDVHLLLLEDTSVAVGPQTALFLEPFLDGK